MKKYSMKCSCGHVLTVDANTREEAVEKMKAMMDQNALDQHWTENHQNDTMPKPTLEQAHMQIEQNMVEGETGEAFRTTALADTTAVEKALTTRSRRKVNMPLDLLEYRSSKANSGDIDRNMEIIQRTLKNFGIEVENPEASWEELEAAGCERLTLPGQIPVKFRDPNGVVAELVPVGRYKKP